MLFTDIINDCDGFTPLSSHTSYSYHRRVRGLSWVEHEGFDSALPLELDDKLGFAFESDREAPAVDIAIKYNNNFRFLGLFAPNFEPVGGLREVDPGELAARAMHHVCDLHANGSRFLS